MARKSSGRKSASAKGNSTTTEILDWVISILLVVLIIGLAIWVCSNPKKESTDNESFWLGYEGFSEEKVIKINNAKKVSELDNVKEGELGCCLMYYEQCGHCQNFKPTWKSVCEKAHGKTIKGRKVKMFECGDDGDKQVWRSVSNRFGVSGYPTIMVKIGGKGAQWQEYNGSREALLQYINQ